MIEMNLQNRERLTDLADELMVARGEGIAREFRKVVYTLLHSKWITSKDLLYSTGNSARCYVAAWMEGEFGGGWLHVYVWLSPFAVHWNHHNIVNRLCCCCCLHAKCLILLQPHGLQLARFLWPWDFSAKSTWVGWHFLLQGIFRTQGLNLHHLP